MRSIAIANHLLETDTDEAPEEFLKGAFMEGSVLDQYVPVSRDPVYGLCLALTQDTWSRDTLLNSNVYAVWHIKGTTVRKVDYSGRPYYAGRLKVVSVNEESEAKSVIKDHVQKVLNSAREWMDPAVEKYRQTRQTDMYSIVGLDHPWWVIEPTSTNYISHTHQMYRACGAVYMRGVSQREMFDSNGVPMGAPMPFGGMRAGKFVPESEVLNVAIRLNPAFTFP